MICTMRSLYANFTIEVFPDGLGDDDVEAGRELLDLLGKEGPWHM